MLRMSMRPGRLRKNGRKPRLVFGGAIYHIISRGNYRRRCLRKVARPYPLRRHCLKRAESATGLHAYVVMSNRYHLALETP